MAVDELYVFSDGISRYVRDLEGRIILQRMDHRYESLAPLLNSGVSPVHRL